MATRVLKLVFARLVPIFGLATLAMLSCNKKHVINPIINPRPGSILISFSPPQITLPSADAIDTAIINIAVVDSDGVGVRNADVSLSQSPDTGIVIQPGLTDSSGMTSGQYITAPGYFGEVTFYVTSENVADTARLTITQATNHIGRIIANPQKRNLVANGLDTSSIFVTVLDSTEAPMVDSTDIYVHNTGIGILSSNHISIFDGSGQARIKITAPVNIIIGPTVDTVYFEGSNSEPILAPDTLIIHYIPGPISHIDFVYPESTLTLLTHSGDTCSVVAFATDVNGNPVTDGTQIYFHHAPVVSSSLVPPYSSAIEGIVRSVYVVGGGTGDDFVTAWALNPTNINDTIRTNPPVIFRCIASDSITLTLSAAHDSIEVGGHSTLIMATVEGMWGPIFDGFLVDYEIITPGCSFDSLRQVSRDTIYTNINGQALEMLYSGNRTGPVTIRACTIPSIPDSIYACDERPLVTITPGAPYSIDFTINNEGSTDPDTLGRYCQGCANVFDRFSNPIENGLSFQYAIMPESIAEINPDGGHCFRINYECNATFLPIRIVAAATTESGTVVDTSGIFGLPIYQGNLIVSANPESLWVENDSCALRDTSDVTITLTDGGGCPINGGIIQFSAQIAGDIIGNSADTTDNNGQASAKYMIRGCDIPCHDNECSIETIVRAVLVQRPSVVGTANIICSRPPQ